MNLIEGIRAGLGVACAMLVLLVVAVITFAFAIWAAVATVVP